MSDRNANSSKCCSAIFVALPSPRLSRASSPSPRRVGTVRECHPGNGQIQVYYGLRADSLIQRNPRLRRSIFSSFARRNSISTRR
jgi:hypothetical protein